jgi:hypothetical protein
MNLKIDPSLLIKRGETYGMALRPLKKRFDELLAEEHEVVRDIRPSTSSTL